VLQASVEALTAELEQLTVLSGAAWDASSGATSAPGKSRKDPPAQLGHEIS
jgi:hypothetical protein